MTVSSIANHHYQWWGNFTFAANETMTWDFASLEISIQHLEKEWVTWKQYISHFDLEEAGQPQFYKTTERPDIPAKYDRFIYTQTNDQLDIMPNLPDRNIVAKPINAITLMPNQEVTLFVGAVLWFSAKIKGASETLFETPIRQLSDTWFGPSPRLGELCYASKTHAYIDKKMLTHKPYRALIPVTIRNQNIVDALKIEKINVPVTMLELYCDSQGQFWTNGIQLLKEAGSSHVQIKTESARRSPYFNSKDSQLIAPPRKLDQSGLVSKAYDMLFS